MPTPSRAPVGVRLSRRTALTAAAVALGGAAVGCTPEPGGRRSPGHRETQPAPVEPSVDPDVAVATAALEGQQALVELVEATLERHPRLEELLAPVLTTHQAHAALLDEAVPEGEHPSAPAGPSPSASPGAPTSPEASESPGGRRTPVPRRRDRALGAVVEAERTLTTTTKQLAFRAQSGAFARVLGSMAAAAAQQAAVLGSSTAPGGGS
ncbi:MAG TPA: hypothetical protein VFZ64_09665 [Nocardioidaceae bacterium]